MLKIVVAIFLSLNPLLLLAQDTSTVIITEGFGKDVESATQRAAEAALIQVVGSFIDSSKMIEKRKEIRDGVRSKTKNITSKISEYSQGMIQSIDVLDAEQDGDFTRVSAKVTVRIEDFKRYIKESVLAERRVKKGLLSKIKIKKKQKTSAVDLVANKVLYDLSTYQVVTPIINGDIEEVTDLDRAQKVTSNSDEYIIKIPVKVTINPEFLENASRILDETAEGKYGKGEFTSIERSERFYSISIGDVIYNERGNRAPKGKSLYTLKSPVHFQAKIHPKGQFITYIFPERIGFDLCEATKRIEYEKISRDSLGHLRGKKISLPSIGVSFVGANGESLKELYLYGKDYWGAEDLMSNEDVYVSSVSSGKESGSRAALLLHYSLDSRFKKNKFRCNIVIDTVTEYLLVTSVSEDILANTSKVTVKYIAPKNR